MTVSFLRTPLFLLLILGFVWPDGAMAEASSLRAKRHLADRYVSEIYDDAGPGAAMLIARNGKVIWSRNIGLADLEWGLPIDDETVFRLGSVSKPLTAVAVLKLVDEGKLRLDVPISAYAPALPEAMGRVTLRQLLSHRSGLAEHAWNPDILQYIWQPVTTDQMIKMQAEVPTDFPPGTQYAYVNFNYVLVAHVLEQVTDQSFVAFSDEAMFASWGLSHSSYDWHDRIIPKRAEFYDKKEGVVLNAQDVDLTHVSAAGALLSTTRDMARWADLLMRGTLISDASRTLAFSAAPLPDGTPTSYGLGFNVDEMAGQALYWHNGLTPGSQAAMGMVPDEGLFVVVLANGFYVPNTTKTMRGLLKIMLTGEAPTPHS